MQPEYQVLIDGAREYVAADHPPSDLQTVALEVVAWADGERPWLTEAQATELLQALAAFSILEAARLMSANLANVVIPVPDTTRPH